MIDRIKNIVYSILNKEKVGAVKPARFIDSCIKAQNNIQSNYFEPEKFKSRNRRAAGHSGNSIKMLEEKLSPFLKEADLASTTGLFTLPEDLYFIDERGVMYNDVSEVDLLNGARFRREAGSTTFPVGTLTEGSIKVKPTTITGVSIDYYRKPKDPKWTYTEEGGVAYFNPDASDFQDFELHPSEEPNLITEILLDFGIIKRELNMVQLIDNFKKTEDANDSRLL
jgi:hypothetical protein